MCRTIWLHTNIVSPKNMKSVDTFCRQVRARSVEHSAAVRLLSAQRLISPLIATLRQELDSLIRVIFLLSIRDREYRAQLTDAAVHGKKWTHRGTRRRITDRDMVNLASKLHGWTESVYGFGCAFVHLSNFHDHGSRDPFLALSKQEREVVLHHMRYYHGGPSGPAPTFDDLVPFLPRVFEKIAGNLECYVKQLELDEEHDEKG